MPPLVIADELPPPMGRLADRAPWSRIADRAPRSRITIRAPRSRIADRAPRSRIADRARRRCSSFSCHSDGIPHGILELEDACGEDPLLFSWAMAAYRVHGRICDVLVLHRLLRCLMVSPGIISRSNLNTVNLFHCPSTPAIQLLWYAWCPPVRISPPDPPSSTVIRREDKHHRCSLVASV